MQCSSLADVGVVGQGLSDHAFHIQRGLPVGGACRAASHAHGCAQRGRQAEARSDVQPALRALLIDAVRARRAPPA